ncbi:feruloyl esterase b [Seiridium cupressi]
MGKQAETIRQLLSPMYGVNGSFVYPRMEPVPGFPSFVNTSYSAEQFLYTDHWFKYGLHNDPNFNTNLLRPENWEHIFENDPVGLQDTLISSASSDICYNLAFRTMNLPRSGLDDFIAISEFAASHIVWPALAPVPLETEDTILQVLTLAIMF